MVKERCRNVIDLNQFVSSDMGDLGALKTTKVYIG
jgi:hypothetical protein